MNRSFYKDKCTRVGLIVTMSPDETWPDTFMNRVKAYLPEVRDCGEIARTAQAMTAQGESLRREGIHALIIYVGTWTYSNTAVMASIKADVPVIVWANSDVETFGIVGDWIMGGACPRYVGKPGRVTIARLSRVNREYVMLVTRGEALEMPLEKIKETNSQQPHVFVRLDCPQDRFIESLRSNHIHVVYGDYREELLVACDVLNIRPIVP